MKRIISYCLLSLALFSSCGVNVKDESPISHFPFKETKSENWGLIDPNGNVLIADEFKNMPTCVANGIFFVPTHSGFEMYNISDPKINIGNKYKDITLFYDSITPVLKDYGRISYIGKNGDEIFTIPSYYFRAESFHNGYSKIGYTKEGLFIFAAVDLKGEIFKSDVFSITDVLPGDRFIAEKYQDKDDSSTYIIDKNEKVIKNLGTGFRALDQNQKGDMNQYTYIDNNLRGVRDFEGNMIIRAKYDSMFIHSPYFCAYLNDGWGILSSDGAVKVGHKYYKILNIKDDYFVAKLNEEGGYGLLDIDENRILKYDYDYIYFLPNSNNLLVRKNDEQYESILTVKGEKIKEADSISFNTPQTIILPGVSLMASCMYTVDSLSKPISHAKNYITDIKSNSRADIIDYCDYLVRWDYTEKEFGYIWEIEKSRQSMFAYDILEDEVGKLSIQLGFNSKDIAGNLGIRLTWTLNDNGKHKLSSLKSGMTECLQYNGYKMVNDDTDVKKYYSEKEKLHLYVKYSDEKIAFYFMEKENND